MKFKHSDYIYLARKVYMGERGGTRELMPREYSVGNLEEWGVYNKEFSVEEDAIYWYKKFLSLAKANNIKIYLYHAPMIEQVIEKRKASGFYVKYKQVVSDILKEFDNVLLLDSVYKAYPLEYFMDPMHLNEKGGILFSAEIGNRFSSKMVIERN